MFKRNQALDCKYKDINSSQKKNSGDKYVYIKLKLPIDKISREYKNSFKKKIRKNFTKPKISLVTRNDIPCVVKLYNRAGLTSTSPFRPITIEQLTELYNDPKYELLIAQLYGIDAGFAIVGYEGLNDEYGVIDGLGIIPRFQRKGVGTALGIAVWNIFNQKQVKELRCEVHYRNYASLNFVKSLGFEEYDLSLYFIDDTEGNISKEERSD